MSSMNRSFSNKEKVIILILVIILMLLGYYYFIDQPIRKGMKEAQYRKEELETEYEVVSIKVMQLKQMEQELETMDFDAMSIMPSYNSSKEEMAFLNNLLFNTDYNVSFQDVMLDGDQVRRPFTLRFTAKSYAEAEAIMQALYDSHDRCLIANVNMGGKSSEFDEDENMLTGPVEVALSAFFYETMVGGESDAGLPAPKIVAPVE